MESAEGVCVPATPLLTMWPQASWARKGGQPLCSHRDPRNCAENRMRHLAQAATQTLVLGKEPTRASLQSSLSMSASWGKRILLHFLPKVKGGLSGLPLESS